MILNFFKYLFSIIIILQFFIVNTFTIENFSLKDKKQVDSENISFYVYSPGNIGIVVIQQDTDANKAQNFSIEIAFKTPTENNKGTMHIIEHCILNGSENYPIKDLFYAVKNEYPASYIDATTYHDFTCYSLETSSKKDFFLIFDVLWDCIFRPKFLTDKKIFQKESFFYDSHNNNLINGSVFYEVAGTYTFPQKNICRFINKQLFDNSYQCDCGGTPWNILDLTYKEAIDFYKKYYVPSNMLIVLRGNYNLNKILTYLDKEYFSKILVQKNLNKIELRTDSSSGTPTKYFISEYDSTIYDEGKIINATYLLKDREIETFIGASILSAICNSKSSDFKKIALEKGYDNLVLEAIGGNEKMISFWSKRSIDSNLNLQIFESDIKDILIKTLETLTEKYLSDVCNSVKSNLLKRKLASKKSIETLVIFNNFTYYNDPLKDIEKYSQININEIVDKVCNISYLKNFLQNNIISSDRYTIGKFLPKKNLNELLISNAFQKLKNYVISNKISNMSEERTEFEKWLAKKDILADILECKLINSNSIYGEVFND